MASDGVKEIITASEKPGTLQGADGADVLWLGDALRGRDTMAKLRRLMRRRRGSGHGLELKVRSLLEQGVPGCKRKRALA